MPTVALVPATPELAELMAPGLRREDTLEVWASAHLTPLEALKYSMYVSPDPYVLLFNDEPVAMFGVQPLNMAAGVGIGWLLGTDAINRYPVTFYKMCLAQVGALMRDWAVLLNWIDARYEKSIKWALSLGFHLDEPRPFGPDGQLFCCAALVR